MKNQNLEELKTCMASLKQSIADMSQDTNKDMMNQMYRICDGIYSYIDSVANNLYNHTNTGHLPKIVGAGKMNKALKALGLDDDFQAEKRSIFASKHVTIIEV